LLVFVCKQDGRIISRSSSSDRSSSREKKKKKKNLTTLNNNENKSTHWIRLVQQQRPGEIFFESIKKGALDENANLKQILALLAIRGHHNNQQQSRHFPRDSSAAYPKPPSDE